MAVPTGNSGNVGTASNTSIPLPADEPALLQEIEAAKLCMEIFQQRDISFSPSLKNTVVLARSFAGYKKWDKAITYAKQSRKHCEDVDKDLYKMCLAYRMLAGFLEQIGDMEAALYQSLNPEPLLRQIESALRSGNNLDAEAQINKLRTAAIESVVKEWDTLIEDTEDMLSVCRADKVNTGGAEEELSKARDFYAKDMKEEAVHSLIKTRARIKWARELKLTKGIDIKEESEEDARKKDTERKQREELLKTRYAGVMQKIGELEKRSEDTSLSTDVLNLIDHNIRKVKHLVQDKNGNPCYDDVPENAEPQVSAVRC
ncbi:MAG: hypothetical protein QW728_05895 [Thermoplasmata archaeon]